MSDLKDCITCRHHGYGNVAKLSGEFCRKGHVFCGGGWPVNCSDYEPRPAPKKIEQPEIDAARKAVDEFKNGLAGKLAEVVSIINGILSEEPKPEPPKKQGLLDRIKAGLEEYHKNYGRMPDGIIANEAAWRVMEKEVRQYMYTPTKAPYATFYGVKIYKTDDGCKLARVRIVSVMKTITFCGEGD